MRQRSSSRQSHLNIQIRRINSPKNVQPIQSSRGKYRQSLYPTDDFIPIKFQFPPLTLKQPHLQDLNSFLVDNEQFKNKIIQNIITIIQNVSSNSFNLLAQDKISSKQAKNFASKNILQNLKLLCSMISSKIKQKYEGVKKQFQKAPRPLNLKLRNKPQYLNEEYYTDRKIEKNPPKNQINQLYKNRRQNMKKRSPSIEISSSRSISSKKTINQGIKVNQRVRAVSNADNLIHKVTRFIINELPIIIHQIVLNYPIHPATGFTSELKNAVKSIDFREDYALEFFSLNGKDLFVFEKGKQIDKGKFNKDIMKFLNKIIEIPQETVPDQAKGWSILDSFESFNKNLAWISTITQIPIEKQNSKKQNLMKYFIDPKKETLAQIHREYFGEIKSVQQLIKKRDADILSLQNKRKFEVSAKISKNVIKFESDQIENEQLKFKCSALLRVVAKWIEDIENIMKDSDKYLRDNGYNFKDNNNKLMYLNHKQRKMLHKHAKLKLNILQLNSQGANQNISLKESIDRFIANLMKQEQKEQIQYKFEKSLKISNQLNAYYAKKIVEKLRLQLQILRSIPIEAAKDYKKVSLAKIYEQKRKNEYSTKPSDIEKNRIAQLQDRLQKQTQQLQNINLICNRLGDLLRARIYCTQPEFIKLLKLLYALDDYCLSEKNKFFRLIRIKNKLKQQNNLVHINYMFYENIQCQLQICFQTGHVDKKIKNNDTMNHFLYELERGMLGVILQLANIINQNDPIYSQNQQAYTIFKKFPHSASVHFFKERQSKNQLIQIWRCCNKYCDYFSVQGKCKFIQETDKYICLNCDKIRTGDSWNIFNVIDRLINSGSESQERLKPNKKWIRDFIKMFKVNAKPYQTSMEVKEDNQDMPTLEELDDKIFMNQDQKYQGVFLVIYPTQKYISAEFNIIFYSKICRALVIKSLENPKSKAKQFKEDSYKAESKYLHKFYIKVNKTNKLLQAILQNKNFLINLKQLILKKTLNQKKLVAQKQLNVGDFMKKITNKQQEIRISFRHDLQDKIQEIRNIGTDLSFAMLFKGDNLCLKDTQFYFSMKNVKKLYLSNNKIAGKVTIENYPNLTDLKMNKNQITKISILNAPLLSNLELNQNKIATILYTNIDRLQKLGLQYNQFESKLSLDELPSLTQLNINYNKNLQALDLKASSKLKSLLCRKLIENRSAIEIIFHKDVKLTQLILFNSMMGEENIKILSHISTLQRLGLDLTDKNYQFLLKKQNMPSIANLNFLALHIHGLSMQNRDKIEQFVRSMPKIQEIVFHFENSSIFALDLTNVKTLQKLTLIDIGLIKRSEKKEIEKYKSIKLGKGIQKEQKEQDLQPSVQLSQQLQQQSSQIQLQASKSSIDQEQDQIKKEYLFKQLSLGEIQALIIISPALTKLQLASWDSLKQLTVFNAKALQPKNEIAPKSIERLELIQTNLIRKIKISQSRKLKTVLIHDIQKQSAQEITSSQNVYKTQINCSQMSQLRQFDYIGNTSEHVKIENCPNLQAIRIFNNQKYQPIIEAMDINPQLSQSQQSQFHNLNSIKLNFLKVRHLNWTISPRIKKIEIEVNFQLSNEANISFLSDKPLQLDKLLIPDRVISKFGKLFLNNRVQSIKSLQFGISGKMGTKFETKSICSKISNLHLLGYYSQQKINFSICISEPIQILYLPLFIQSIEIQFSDKVHCIFIREPAVNGEDKKYKRKQQKYIDENMNLSSIKLRKKQNSDKNKRPYVYIQVRKRREQLFKNIVEASENITFKFEELRDSIVDSIF